MKQNKEYQKNGSLFKAGKYMATFNSIGDLMLLGRVACSLQYI